MANGTPIGFMVVGLIITIISFFGPKLALFSILGVGMILYGVFMLANTQKSKSILHQQSHTHQRPNSTYNSDYMAQHSRHQNNQAAKTMRSTLQRTGPLHGLSRSAHGQPIQSQQRTSHPSPRGLHTSQQHINMHNAHQVQNQNAQYNRAPLHSQHSIHTTQTHHVHKTSATKLCPNCRQTISAQYKHCPHCGFTFFL
jgi:hypothetical protein